MIKKILLSAALLALPVSAASAQVTGGNTNRTCALNDISFGMPTQNALACTGFFSGNALAGNAPNVAIQNNTINALLGTSGVNYWTSYIEADSPTDGNFDAMLYGITVIGIHWGNGAPVFGGDPAYTGSGGGTSFYKIDAGAGVDVFQFAQRVGNGQSTGILYMTGTPCSRDCTPVPEPASFGLILGGLAGLGVVARRRKA